MGRQRSPGLHGQCSQKLLRSPRLGPPPPSRARCPFTFADVRPGKSSGCILRLTWKYRSSSTQSAPVELSEKSSVGTVGHVQHAEGVIPSISRKISQVVPSLAALILPFKGKSEFYVRNTYKTYTLCKKHLHFPRSVEVGPGHQVSHSDTASLKAKPHISAQGFQ